MTGGAISGNGRYSIEHVKNTDGTCRITNGTVNGAIYLGQNDNYVNTYSSYPTLTVTPSTYWLGRKLVKTDSNAIARTEIAKVTLTPKDTWYKYIQSETDQFIVVWKGGNVRVKHIDKVNTTVLAQELLNDDIGKTWTSSPKTIDGYRLVEEPATTTGTYTSTDVNLTYYYKRISPGIDVKYIDQVTRQEIIPTKHIGGLEADDYSVSPEVIDGYELVNTPSNVSGKMTMNKITITYEYRKTSYVTTKFIDENTNEELADSVVIKYKQEDEYVTEEKAIPGYTITNDTGNLSGVVEREDIEVIYYYKKLTRLTVKYIDMYTGTEISDCIDRVALQNDIYSTQEREISGYRYKEVEGEVAGRMPGDPLTVTYKYAKLSKVTVQYYDENTGLKIAYDEEPVLYEQKENYTTTSKEIDGYTLTKNSGNTADTMVRDDIYVRYYYKKNTKVTVKYVDMYTDEVIEKVEIPGLENDNYSTEAKEIAGYELFEVEGKPSGKMNKDPQEVIYRYKKQSNVITQHVDANTKQKIVDDVVVPVSEGEKYEALPQNIPGYVLVEEPDSKKVIMGREDVTKTFYYKKISGGLVVKYVDVKSGEMLDQIVYEGNEEDKIQLDEKEFIHYVIYERPNVDSIDLTVDSQEVIFKYIRESKVEIEGVDQETREVLYTTEITGIEGERYEAVPRDLEEYTVVNIPDNSKAVFTRNNIKVVYEYRKNTGKVVVKYIDKDTKEVLDLEEITGLYGENYETVQKTFENYNFDRVEGPVVGKQEEGTKEVIYYYTRKSGKVVVRYVDQSGKEVLRTETVEKVGQPYKVEEKEIKGYEIVERPDNLEGQYIDGIIEVRFTVKKKSEEVVVKKIGTIMVNLVDENGNKIGKTIVEKDEVGKDFYFSAPEIPGYKIVKNETIKSKFVEGEVVFDVCYEKIEDEQKPAPTPVLPVEKEDKEEKNEDVKTGDINVAIIAVIAIISMMGLAIVYKRKVAYKK